MKKRRVRVRLLKKFLTLSNLLTLSRILLTPFVVWAIYSGWSVTALTLFFVAAITDLLDGYFARLFNEPTVLGTYLDPIADKILLISCFIALVYFKFPSLQIPDWFILFIVARELVIFIGGAIMIRKSPGKLLLPTKTGKVTIFAYSLLIGWILLCHVFSWMPLKSFNGALYGIVLLSLSSLLQYIKREATTR